MLRKEGFLLSVNIHHAHQPLSHLQSLRHSFSQTIVILPIDAETVDDNFYIVSHPAIDRHRFAQIDDLAI